MGNLKMTTAIILKFLLILWSYGYSVQVSANTSEVTASEATTNVSRSARSSTRDKDTKCVQCHKKLKSSIQGSHGEEVADTLGHPVYCVDCHGNIGSNHRNGAPLVTKYRSAQSQVGTEKVHLSQSDILMANSKCTDCHTSSSLQKKAWVHDVHAQNLTCSNCHIVHGSKQKVLSFDRKEKIKLCVDCHSDFNEKQIEQEK